MSESSHAKSKTPLLGDLSYNVLKQATTIALPAAGALYFALAQIWHLPKAEEVVGSVAALNTFFGVILGFSTKSYNKSDAKYVGEIHVQDDGYKKTAALVVDGDPEDILSMKEATFKISDTGENPVIQK